MSSKDKAIEKDPRDLIQRSDKSSSPLGTTIFVGLRLLDGFVLQRLLITQNPLTSLFYKLNLSVPPPPPTGGLPTTIPLPILNTLAPLTPFQTLIWTLSIGSALKQVIWILYVSKETMPPPASLIICVFNSLFNATNTLAFSLAASNPTWSPAILYAALPVYTLGLLVETYSEFQRKWFKDDPANAGKPYSGGLFSLARSVNYFGYTLWRSAFAAAGGGWVWGAVVAAFFTWDFTKRAIPVLDDYCSKRYGEGWEEVKRKVPYCFCPGVY